MWALVLALGSFVALLSLGLNLVLRAGRLDLSVAAVAALAGVLAGRIEAGSEVLLPGLVAAAAVGVGFGVVNGLLGCLSRTAAAAATIGTAAVVQMLAYQTSASPFAFSWQPTILSGLRPRRPPWCWRRWPCSGSCCS